MLKSRLMLLSSRTYNKLHWIKHYLKVEDETKALTIAIDFTHTVLKQHADFLTGKENSKVFNYTL